MVIDDSPALQQKIIGYYRPLGHIVEYASNGPDGITKFEQFKPDIIFLDIIMPLMGGEETLRRIMKLDSNARVIIISASDSTSLIMQCLQGGGSIFVPKPFTMEQLNGAIERTMKSGPRSNAISQ
ncbi:MAG: response regulator [Thaumarchaeota archaeon]|nr:response regulator [Nitrososphaerota archaeon]